MKNATQQIDTAIDAGTGRPAVLKKRWIVAPAETTSRNLDKIVKHKSESDVSKQSGSSSSLLLTNDDSIGNFFRDFSAYQHALVTDMLQAIENIVQALPIGLTDTSTPVLGYYSRRVDDQAVKSEVERLFSLATFIDLEPGMENEFSEGLEQVVERHGIKALDAIERIILNEATAASIAMETLKYIGNSDSNRWHNERRLMLEDCLRRSRSAWVRDGAGLGLSCLDNPLSIPAVERAITKESSNALKEDLKLVLNQLKRTLGA